MVTKQKSLTESLKALRESEEPKTEKKMFLKIECNDPDGHLKAIIEAIKKASDPGHCCSIKFDPESEIPEEFCFDGDGSDRIVSVEVVEEEVPVKD